MNWTHSEELFEEENNCGRDPMIDEDEENKVLQLHKFEHPSKDLRRQEYINTVSSFGDLLISHKIGQIAQNMLTEDCQVFHFTSTGKHPIRHGESREGFLELYRELKILERKVRQTFVDVDKSTVFQLCNCKVFYEDDNSIADEITFEAFSITDAQISKYRVCFAQLTTAHGDKDPLEATRKDIMLAKVKEINYALAGKPDFEKVASLLHQSTEYKIWAWGSKKCSILCKDDFVSGFRDLEKEYTIDSIVPYGVFQDREYVVGTYVYCLERKSCVGQKFVWLSTSVYAFDSEINISKVNQQGELFPEDEAPGIPFETYSRDRLTRMIDKMIGAYQSISDVFYHNDVDFNCDIYQFGLQYFPDTGKFDGISYAEQLKTVIGNEIKNEWIKVADAYVDYHDPSYDTAIVFTCSQGAFVSEGYRYNGISINVISVGIFRFENGHLSKVVMFVNEVPEPIPSPFDNKSITALNIK